MPEDMDPERVERHRRANNAQTEASLERIAERVADKAAAKAVEQTFRMLGIDLTNVETVNKLRDDFRWTRKEREQSEVPGVGKIAMVTSVTVAITAGITWGFSILTGFIHFGPPPK